MRFHGTGHVFAVLAVGVLVVLGAIAGRAGADPASATGNASVLVSSGAYHTCVLTTGGGAKCWGDNSAGQLGDGTTTDSSASVDVAGLTSGVAAVSSGGGHSCALTTAGGVKCWGWNLYGQLGNGLTTDSTTPVDVTGLTSGVASVAVGIVHTCAVTTGGGVKCWGQNVDGQLGNGTLVDSNMAVDVTGLTSGVAAVSAGGGHTCALTTGSGVKCWGGNGDGQLGDGTFTGSSTPVDTIGLASGVATVSAGGRHSCAISSGGAQCWGFNLYGQLGNGFTTNASNPVAVTGLTSGVAAVSVAGLHTCALTLSGGAKCWGNNLNGQLGNGTTTNSSPAVNVTSMTSGVSAVSAGGFHTCAITTSAGAMCWGDNAYGQLGNGTTTDSSLPVVASLKGPSDTDGDGCPDAKEQQMAAGTELSGGRRDYFNPDDYYNPSHDGVNRVDDILLVVQAYFDDDDDGNPGLPPYEPGYAPDFDRTYVGPLAWNLGPPNGLQRVDDILNQVKQYYHDCS